VAEIKCASDHVLLSTALQSISWALQQIWISSLDST